MTLTIDLNAEAESRLKTAASRQGLEPEAYAKQLIERNLPTTDEAPIDQATLDLLARWDAEDATTDPEEIAAQHEEFEAFKRAMNEDRLQAEGPSSRKLYP